MSYFDIVGGMSGPENNVHPFPRGGRDIVNEVKELQRVARENTLQVPEDVRMSDSSLLRSIIRAGQTQTENPSPEQLIIDDEL